MLAKQIIESKYFKVAAFMSGIFLIALISFAAGVKVGLHKALFSAHFGENYERNFLGDVGDRGGHSGRMMGKMMDKGMRNAHGMAGEILSMGDNTFVIKGRDNQESTVRLNESTIINRGKETVEFGSHTVGNKIVVVGKPQDDGVIAAHLVRVFPVDSSQ